VITNDLSTKQYNILLFDNAPILSLSFHAQLSKKYSLEYRSYNGATDLKVNKNDEEDIIVDVLKKDIPPFEISLWVAPGLQLPFIRMNITLGFRGLGSKAARTKKPGEVSKNKDTEEYIDDKAGILSLDFHNSYDIPARDQFTEIFKQAKKQAKKDNKSFNDLSDEDKVFLLFYTLRYTKLINFKIEDLTSKINSVDNSYNGLALALYCTMKVADLDPAILICNNRTNYRLNEIMSPDDLETTAYITGAQKFLSIKSIFDIPFTGPAEIEGAVGTKSFTFDMGGSVRKLTNIDEGFNVPTSSADKNAHIENLKLQLNSEKNTISVNRSTTLKGYYKADAQKELILYEDFYEEERKAFNDEKSLIETLEDNRKGKKYVDEVKSAFEEARKNQKVAFTKEAKDWFDAEVTNLKDFKTDTLGVRHTAPNFVYSSSFNLDGLVKKAGNNVIIEIGKIQGLPFIVKPEQRKRDIDIYMPFARSLEYNIELQIPDGYTADGIAALNKNVTSSAGFFTVVATASDKIISIKIKKHYLHNFESSNNWANLLLFIDAASDWTTSKILLKKK